MSTNSESTNIIIKENSDKVLKILPVLEEWLNINAEYIELTAGRDCLYMYNERASVSSLAGAVWRKGGFAQEEYCSVKGLNARNGRVDLYFICNGTSVICEAKQLDVSINPKARKVYFDEISCSLANAIRDAKETKIGANYQDLTLAITFVVCSYSTAWEVERLIDEFYNDLDDVKCDFIVPFCSYDIDVNDGANNLYNHAFIVGSFV